MHFFRTLGEYVHIYISKPYINMIPTTQPIHSMSYFSHMWIHNTLYFWGTHILYAHLTHAISWNLLNVSTRSHMHTWYSELLGNPCTTYTPAYMSSRSMPYNPAEYHYTYVPHPIPSNIGIPIRLAQSKCNQIIHHNAMYAHCFVSVSLLARLQPQDLFLRLQPQGLIFLSMRLQP
jgi:hypothetical protein